ncbi:hypothetical protein BJX70DRAFT_267793 [Aspergillus crustosus]
MSISFTILHSTKDEKEIVLRQCWLAIPALLPSRYSYLIPDSTPSRTEMQQRSTTSLLAMPQTIAAAILKADYKETIDILLQASPRRRRRLCALCTPWRLYPQVSFGESVMLDCCQVSLRKLASYHHQLISFLAVIVVDSASSFMMIRWWQIKGPSTYPGDRVGQVINPTDPLCSAVYPQYVKRINGSSLVSITIQ